MAATKILLKKKKKIYVEFKIVLYLIYGKVQYSYRMIPRKILIYFHLSC